jgi:HEAT repeat protein
LLADAHPGVRREVCEGLVRLAEKPELIEPIRDAARQVLAGDRWQGQEQAALLLGALEYKPVADRLVELLESPRPEVMVASAWALRKVAVPETIPALIDKAQRQTERRRQVEVPGAEDQIVHLFEALGVLKADDALPLLVQYIPKPVPNINERSRSAAVWAIGQVSSGKPDAELADALAARINDFSDQNPEFNLVKQMGAVALARIQAVDQAPLLREMATAMLPLPLRAAMRWAVQELTGEELPPLEPMTAGQGNWFLEPYP